MAVNEQIVTGRYYRRLIDEINKLWERISFWNKASDTECDDGQTVETKIGAFKGVTKSTNVTIEGYAADATVVSNINNNLAQGQISFSVVDGEPYVKVGADAARPFSGLFKTGSYLTRSNPYPYYSDGEDAVTTIITLPVTAGKTYAITTIGIASSGGGSSAKFIFDGLYLTSTTNDFITTNLGKVKCIYSSYPSITRGHLMLIFNCKTSGTLSIAVVLNQHPTLELWIFE